MTRLSRILLVSAPCLLLAAILMCHSGIQNEAEHMELTFRAFWQGAVAVILGIIGLILRYVSR